MRLTAEEIEAKSARNRAARTTIVRGPDGTAVIVSGPEYIAVGGGGGGVSFPITEKKWEFQLMLSLPFPPSVNGYWRNLGDRTILSARAREYRKAMLSTVGARTPLLGRLSCEITLFPPDKRRRDLDNYMKSLFDALQHCGVYRDDEQIDDFRVVRGPQEKGGRCMIVIKEI